MGILLPGGHDHGVFVRRRHQGHRQILPGTRTTPRATIRRSARSSPTLGPVRDARLRLGMVCRRLARRAIKAPKDGRRRRQGATDHVLRGGAYADPAEACRSAYRHFVPADTRSDASVFAV